MSLLENPRPLYEALVPVLDVLKAAADNVRSDIYPDPNRTKDSKSKEQTLGGVTEAIGVTCCFGHVGHVKSNQPCTTKASASKIPVLALTLRHESLPIRSKVVNTTDQSDDHPVEEGAAHQMIAKLRDLGCDLLSNMTTLQGDLRRAGVDFNDSQRTTLLVNKSKDILFSQEVLNAIHDPATTSAVKTGKLSDASDSKVQSFPGTSHEASHLLTELPFNIPVQGRSNRSKLQGRVHKEPNIKVKNPLKGVTKHSQTASTSDITNPGPIQHRTIQEQQDNGHTQPLNNDQPMDGNDDIKKDTKTQSREELYYYPGRAVADTKPKDPDTELTTLIQDTSDTEAQELDKKADQSPLGEDAIIDEASTKNGHVNSEAQVENDLSVIGSNSAPDPVEAPTTLETPLVECDEEASTKMRGLLSRSNTDDGTATENSQTDGPVSGTDTVNVDAPEIPSVVSDAAEPTSELLESEEANIGKSENAGEAEGSPEYPIPEEEGNGLTDVFHAHSDSEIPSSQPSQDDILCFLFPDLEELPGPIPESQDRNESEADEDELLCFLFPDLEEVPGSIPESQDQNESRAGGSPQQTEGTETYTIPEEEGNGLAHVFTFPTDAQDLASQRSVGGDLCFLDGTLTNYGCLEDFPNAEPVPKPVAKLEDSDESKIYGSPQKSEKNEAPIFGNQGHTDESDQAQEDEREMHDGAPNNLEKDGQASTKGLVETAGPKTPEAKGETQIGLEKSYKQSQPFVPEKAEFTFRNDLPNSAKVEGEKIAESTDHAQVSIAESSDGTLAVEHSETTIKEITLPGQGDSATTESTTLVRKYSKFDPGYAAEVIEAPAVRTASSQSASTISSDKRKGSAASTTIVTVPTPVTSAAPSPASSKFQNKTETVEAASSKKSSKKAKKGKKGKAKKAKTAEAVTEPEPESVKETAMSKPEPEPVALQRKTAIFKLKLEPEPESDPMAPEWKPANPKTQKRNEQRRRTRARKQEAKKNDGVVEAEGAKKGVKKNPGAAKTEGVKKSAGFAVLNPAQKI